MCTATQMQLLKAANWCKKARRKLNTDSDVRDPKARSYAKELVRRFVRLGLLTGDISISKCSKQQQCHDKLLEKEKYLRSLASETKTGSAVTPPGTKQREEKGAGIQGDKPLAPGDANATETIDGCGYVTNPKDPTAYVAATVALRKHTPAALATTYKQFRAILDKHPEIRRWQLRGNRLSVHLAEWTAYVQKETSLVDADGLLADQFEVEARKEEIRRKNKTRK